MDGAAAQEDVKMGKKKMVSQDGLLTYVPSVMLTPLIQTILSISQRCLSIHREIESE